MAVLKRVIPCLDMHDGRVVKGVQFVDLQDLGDPVALAQRYEQEGADELVLLDISASPEGRDTARSIVRRVAETLSIPFTVGGGVRSVADIAALLEAGADKISINSAALRQPSLIDEASRHFGAQCIVVAIDFRAGPQTQQVMSHGGRQDSGRDAQEWAREVVSRGAGELLLTCIDRDGTGTGFEQAITGALGRELRVPVIASGGAKTPQHFVDVLRAGADAALAAGIFHRREVRIADVKHAMRDAGIPVRYEG